MRNRTVYYPRFYYGLHCILQLLDALFAFLQVTQSYVAAPTPVMGEERSHGRHSAHVCECVLVALGRVLWSVQLGPVDL